MAPWATALADREVIGATSAADKERYRASVVNDQWRARKTAGQPKKRATRDEEVTNDTGIPPAKRSLPSMGFERWCLQGSWRVCKGCGMAQPRPLTEKDMFRKERPPTTTPARCGNCQSTRPQYAPKPADLPPPLRGLPKEVLAALSPLEVDAGPVVRSRAPGANSGRTAMGYRQRAAMIRFARRKKTVDQRTKKPDAQDARKSARAALSYLLASAESSY